MSGGFVVEDTEARSAAPEYRLATDKRTPLLSLTPRQEAKLRQHLDDRLTQLERDEKKQ
jgi:Spy/CpxP family protein refolding chaperone